MPDNNFWDKKVVLVTGGAGLIGSAFVQELLSRGARVRTVRHRRQVYFAADLEVIDGDLREIQICRKACRGVDTIIHAAGVSGGSKHVTIHGLSMFTDSLLMNTQMMEGARQAGVSRYLFLSNSSVYAPGETVWREEDAWGETSHGAPENETGMVKRVGETQAALYARTTGMKVAIMRTANAYGPRDNFNLESSHVIPALIRKAVEKQNPFNLWGTGEAVRDFIHTRDIACGGLFLLEHYPTARPVNVGTGAPVTILEALRIILRLAGHEQAEIKPDFSAPPASRAKRLDLTLMREFGFEPSLSLEQGLKDTIEWFRANFK